MPALPPKTPPVGQHGSQVMFPCLRLLRRCERQLLMLLWYASCLLKVLRYSACANACWRLVSTALARSQVSFAGLPLPLSSKPNRPPPAARSAGSPLFLKRKNEQSHAVVIHHA